MTKEEIESRKAEIRKQQDNLRLEAHELDKALVSMKMPDINKVLGKAFKIEIESYWDYDYYEKGCVRYIYFYKFDKEQGGWLSYVSVDVYEDKSTQLDKLSSFIKVDSFSPEPNSFGMYTDEITVEEFKDKFCSINSDILEYVLNKE